MPAAARFRCYDEGLLNDAVGDESAPVIWSGDVAGAANVVPACVSEADCLINLASLKGHSYGLTLCGKNHFGSLVNLQPPAPARGRRHPPLRVGSDLRGGVHRAASICSPTACWAARPCCGMLDGLVTAVSEGASVTRARRRYEGAPFDGGSRQHLPYRRNPVAIDSGGADFLINQPAVTSRNAALEGNLDVGETSMKSPLASAAPPSGAAYRDGAGNPVESLGVHEHWNNSVERLYSRDRGESEGIELVRILR